LKDHNDKIHLVQLKIKHYKKIRIGLKNVNHELAIKFWAVQRRIYISISVFYLFKEVKLKKQRT